MKGKRGSSCAIDLGLAVLSSREWKIIPGMHESSDVIAAACGCSRSRIFQIEERALRKLRVRLRYLKDPVLRDVIASLISR
jgi:DNA-directed RNA polymerase sigma subunit (sigma70/sigma32)